MPSAALRGDSLRATGAPTPTRPDAQAVPSLVRRASHLARPTQPTDQLAAVTPVADRRRYTEIDT